MYQQIGRGDQVKTPKMSIVSASPSTYSMPRGQMRLFFAPGICDHPVGAIHTQDTTGALAFQRPGIVAIPASDIQDHKAVNGREHVKKGNGFAVLLDGQAFCLAIGIRNSIVVCQICPLSTGECRHDETVIGLARPAYLLVAPPCSRCSLAFWAHWCHHSTELGR